MSLLVVEDGRLRAALVQRLAQEAEGKAAVASPGAEDLFAKALGHRTVVYAPAPCLLEGKLGPTPDVTRMQRILGAANAPGVRLVVVVVPEGDGYFAELDALRRDGKPYMIVRSAPLLEEVGDVIASDNPNTLWLPSGGAVRAAPGREVARCVAEAMVAENQGSVVDVVIDARPAPTVFRQAAAACGNKVHIHLVAPWIHRLLRPLIRWIRGREPRALSLLDRLFPRPAVLPALPAR